MTSHAQGPTVSRPDVKAGTFRPNDVRLYTSRVFAGRHIACRTSKTTARPRNSVCSFERLRRRHSQCPGTESNRRHEDFQSSALPTELPGLASLTGEFIP